MTRPKRWPTNAESARMEALAVAREIGELGEQAKLEVRAGKGLLVLVSVSEMQLLAKEIELLLVRCKEG